MTTLILLSLTLFCLSGILWRNMKVEARSWLKWLEAEARQTSIAPSSPISKKSKKDLTHTTEAIYSLLLESAFRTCKEVIDLRRGVASIYVNKISLYSERQLELSIIYIPRNNGLLELHKKVVTVAYKQGNETYNKAVLTLLHYITFSPQYFTGDLNMELHQAYKAQPICNFE